MTTTPADIGNPTPTTPEDEQLKDGKCWVESAALRAAMDAKTAPRYTYDAYHAGGNAIFAARCCAEFRPLMLLLPKYDVAHYDRLEMLGRGLRFVQTEILRRSKVMKEIPELATEGYALRAVMLGLAEVLALKDLFDKDLVQSVREGSGYRDLVEDLNVLVAELRTQPEAVIGDATPVTKADLTRAATLAHEINVRIGHDATTDLTHSQLVDERKKLAALLTTAHAQVHRAITFLRHDEGDVEQLVPSLYVPAGRRKTSDDGDGEVEAPPADPVAQLQAATAHLDPEDNPFVTEE